MLGHRVTVYLGEPDEEISGELRQQNDTGVWIYGGFMEPAKMRFYPMRRVRSIEDLGPVYR